MEKSTILKDLLNSNDTLVMPDAYDPISAKIIEYVGFKAVQCSGYSFSISKCYRSELDVPVTENLSITKSIVNAVKIPVMADGEDGFGDGEELVGNIKSYMKTGVAGINIEDQNLRNKNSAAKIIEKDRMLEKIKVAIRSKQEMNCPDFIMNARTDALTAYPDRKEAIKVAVDRANCYLEAGADLCFITKVQEIDEVKLLVKEVKGPISIALGLPYNIHKISVKQCRELGVARVSIPSLAIFTSIKAQLDSLRIIKDSEEFDEVLRKENVLLDMNLLQQLLINK